MKTSMLRQVDGGVTLAIRAQPGAKKTAIMGVHGDAGGEHLKIAIQTPARQGRANEALVAVLAQTFSVSKTAIALVSGELSRSKVFLLRGVTLERARGVLGDPAK